MTIETPRPAWNPVVLIMSAAPLLFIGWVSMGNEFTPDFLTKLHIFLMLAFFYSIILLLSYSVKPSMSAVSNRKNLQIYKKDTLIAEYELGEIKEITAKYIKRNAERPWYEVAIQKNSGEYNVLFKSEFMFSRKQWDHFSEKLSSALEKPLRIEFWAENYDGKLLLISASARHFSQGSLSLINSSFIKLLPFLIMFTGAILTRYTGKIYLFFMMSAALSLTVTYLQTSRTEKYKNAKAQEELSAFYGLFITLPFKLLSMFFFFLFIVYAGNVENVFKLLK